MQATRTRLPDGRWHFQHGPIDIVIGADGMSSAARAGAGPGAHAGDQAGAPDSDAVHEAHEAAWSRFQPLLAELVDELTPLRAPIATEGEPACALRGDVARRMWHAARPFARRGFFITPMVAVAGAVAQELVACYDRPGIARAWINNGGDIALHLAPGASVSVGLFADLARLDAAQVLEGLTLDGRFEVSHRLPVRGIATSGWRGRSFSLGIADSVTVLAATAAQADAAASIIANAVNLDHPGIVRRPAQELRDDSDLGAIPVTVEVPRLRPTEVREALEAGRRRALACQAAGLIMGAVLHCQSQWSVVGVPAALEADGGVSTDGAHAPSGSVFA
jgi:ApbE superfamily uncharacterized protein (UPF0280 family)